MEYQKFLGNFVEDPMNGDETLEVSSSYQLREPEFVRPRLGIPTGFINWEENYDDLQKVLGRTRKSGRLHVRMGDINSKLRMHLEYFRNNLDLYDILIKDQVFSSDELWYRSLNEGPAFSTFIKKSRAFSLQEKISLEECHIPSEYIHEEYKGYDSILHESYLPYWDSSAETEDYLYSFIPDKEGSKNPEFLITQLFEDYKVGIEKPSILFLQPVSGKKSIGEDGLSTTLLKNTWSEDSRPGGNYHGKRVIVPASSGIRDTAVPDIRTLNALKIVGKASRLISEQLPMSANCSFQTLNKRILRMRRCETYLHVDFKKYGLTSPRKAINAVIRNMGIPELQIGRVTLDTGDEVYETNRGSALGWMDSTTAIAVIAILHNLRKKKMKDMDFIVFNDDVEIGFQNKHSEEELLLYKTEIIEELESFDFILSHRKIFYSKMMIFLENYTIRGGTPKDMNKTQLVIKLFSKSLSTPFNWKAKNCYAQGALKIYNTQVRDLCTMSIKEKFPGEYGLPVELGGWTFKLDKELIGDRPLNLALQEASIADISFFLRMKKYKEPHLCEKKEIVNLQRLYRNVDKRIGEAYKPNPINAMERVKFDLSRKLTPSQKEDVKANLDLGIRTEIEEPTAGVDPVGGCIGIT